METLLTLIFFVFIGTIDGAKLNPVYEWKYIDYVWDSNEQKQEAINSGNYNNSAAIMLDVDISMDGRVFVTIFREKGVPVTLGTVSETIENGSPLIRPYPDWKTNLYDSCDEFTNILRIAIDECNQLWVLDSGMINNEYKCPAKLMVFNLENNLMVKQIEIPRDLYSGSLVTLIIHDIDPLCSKPSVYMADIFTGGLVIYNGDGDFCRLEVDEFKPVIDADTYTIGGEKVTLPVGLLGMALTTRDDDDPMNEQKLIFRPLSSFNMYLVTANELRNYCETETKPNITKENYMTPSQSTSQTIADGILFLGYVDQSSLNCWNINKPFDEQHTVMLMEDEQKLQWIKEEKKKKWDFHILHRIFTLNCRSDTNDEIIPEKEMKRKDKRWIDDKSSELKWKYNFNGLTKKNLDISAINSDTNSDIFNDEAISRTSWNNNPLLDYNNNILQKPEPYSQYNFHGYNEIRITNVVPLLVSMTLLGLRQYAAQNEPGFHISQELLPPDISDINDDTGLLYKVASSSSLNADILNSMRSGRYVGNNIDKSRNSNRQNDFNKQNYNFGSSQDYFMNEESPGPTMELMFAWKTVDFEFENEAARERAIYEGKYIPENNMPLGVELWHDKVFIALPKWKTGIPASLATVPRYSKTKSPKLRPYPSWGWHHQDSCGGMTSVFRMQVDQCDRLWIIDSGTVNLTSDPQQSCPPAIFIFDLRSDRLIKRYQIPEYQVKQDSLWSNIVVDIRNDDCNSAKAYISDVWRFAMIIYDLPTDSSFRIQHHFFLPDPLSSRYELHGINFQWIDGILGLALSPVDINNDRTLFFHPMSSFREFAVSTSVIRDNQTAESSAESFVPVGKPRAKDFGHSSGSAIDKNGVMFFNMVTRDSVWCWDTRKEYIPQNMGLIGVGNETLIFPNDIRVDHEERQSFWTISNRLPMYLYGPWDPYDINFRIYRAYVDDAVKNTVCDPNYIVSVSDNSYDETC
ncbi:hypothetical protein PV327_001981 [Microctonus hyperodae]|uniref:Bee-milk protein n=1 Tax=Microctonus hyperodae TaxID=165561 RepID=A0AA39FEN8_MICHY|nr:hypothetical protein PV327_001981 [Microctonus hyperodae]